MADFREFKGIVHQKLNYHPQVVPNLYAFPSSAEHKINKENTIEVNGYQQVFGYQYSSVFNRRKKLLQVWNNMRVSDIFG